MITNTDPLSLILEALAAGIKPLAGKVAEDAYSELKRRIQQLFADNSTAQIALTEYEESSTTNEKWKNLLGNELRAANADHDKAIVQSARQLIDANSLQAESIGRSFQISSIIERSSLQNGNGNTSNGRDQNQLSGNSNTVQSGDGNTAVGGDYKVSHGKIVIPLWHLPLFFLLLSGIGFGSGVVVRENQLIPKLQAKEAEVSTMRNQVDELQQTAKSSTDAQGKISSLEQALNTAQTNINKLNASIKQKDDEASSLNKMISSLKDEVARLQSQQSTVVTSTGSQPSDTKECSGNFVTQDKLDKLQQGMSLAEVEKILGPNQGRGDVGVTTQYKWQLSCDQPFYLNFWESGPWKGLNRIPSLRR